MYVCCNSLNYITARRVSADQFRDVQTEKAGRSISATGSHVQFACVLLLMLTCRLLVSIQRTPTGFMRGTGSPYCSLRRGVAHSIKRSD